MTTLQIEKAERLRKELPGAVTFAGWAEGVTAKQGEAKLAADGEGGESEKGTQAEILVRLALESGAELFHTLGQDSEGYATIPVGDHRETYAISGKAFREWLTRLFWGKCRRPPSSQARQDAIETIRAKARFDGPEASVYIRVAESGGKHYLDLGDPTWKAVEVDANGWRIVPEPPVKFIRRRGMKAIPVPVMGGSLGELRDFVNVAEEDWVLLLAWLVAALRPGRPFPILILTGEQGSAKSTVLRLFRMLLDPNEAPLRAEPRDVRDLVIAASNGWIIALDNLSGLQPWLSDALCRIATGGGFATRELYTDDEEKIFNAVRPTALNGIEEIASRPDLLDRAIILTLPRIPEEKRQTEAAFWARFQDACPRILGALLTAVSTALRNLPGLRLDTHPRMADFYAFAVAAEPAFDVKAGTFAAVYEGNREAANETAIEGSAVAQAIKRFMHELPRWEGEAARLLRSLNAQESEGGAHPPRFGWPQSPRALSGALRRMAPNLRRIGLEVEFDLRNTKGRRMIVLSRTDADPTVNSVKPPKLDATDAIGGRAAAFSGDDGEDCWWKRVKESFPAGMNREPGAEG